MVSAPPFPDTTGPFLVRWPDGPDRATGAEKRKGRGNGMVPFVDLKDQYLDIAPELAPALERVFTSCQFVLGPEVEAFERDFATYLGVEHVVGVGSGTDALHMALLEAGVGPGSEVILPANTFIATALAVTYTGALPVLVDVDERSFNMDAERAEEAITPRTKAIMPVHLYGQSADMDRISDLARERGIAVVEDACQAHGARFGEKRVGTFGRTGCFSFYPGKNLGAYGDGGAVATNDAGVAERLRLLRNYGQKEKYTHSSVGYNSRLDSIQAAVLRVKLGRLDEWNERRRDAAALYDELLAGGVRTPEVLAGRDHVYHIYAVRVEERDRVLAGLADAGITAGVHYPVPVHLQPCYGGLGYGPGDFPVTESLAATELSLPMYPEIGEENVRTVAGALLELVGRRG